MELLPALVNASGWAACVGILGFVIRLIATEGLVPGPTHRRAIARGNFWRDRALAGTQLAETATTVAEEQADAP